MKKTIILILIIFSIINCQSDDDKLNKNDNKTSKSDITLKTFNLKLDKNYFLVNDKVKINVNYEFENKQDNKDLVLRIKSVGEDLLKHQINGVDFIFGKNDAKEKQDFFDNTDNQMYLTPKKTGYLDLEFSGQLYDTVKKEYVGKPIVSKISLVSLKIDLSLSYYTPYTNIDVKFDDGVYETDNFLSTEHDIVEGFDLTVFVDDNEIEATKNINLYKTTKIFAKKTIGGLPKKVHIILKQRLTNGDVNTFEFKHLKFKPKEVTLKSFDLKLDKTYSLINRKTKIKINYKVEKKGVYKNLVLRIRPIGKDITKHQINGIDFIFGKIDVKKKQDFFDNIGGYMYLIPKKAGNLNLEFSGQLYDTVKKQYVGKPIISKISLASLKINMRVIREEFFFSHNFPHKNILYVNYKIDINFNNGAYKSDYFLSTKPDIVNNYSMSILINGHNVSTSLFFKKGNLSIYEKELVEPHKSNIPKTINIVLLQNLTNGNVNQFTFKNVGFQLQTNKINK